MGRRDKVRLTDINNGLNDEQYIIDAFKVGDTWRIFKIISEFVEGFEALAQVGPAVSIFGSSRASEGEPYYDKAQALGGMLAGSGITIITGGGPGIMEAANKGAFTAGGTSIGINIELPFEQKPNKYTTRLISMKHFFIRKVMIVKYAQAFIIFPGGYGTMDEFFEALTLIQTMKIKPFPIILVGKDYWSGLLEWISDNMAGQGLIDPKDYKLIKLIDDIDEIAKEVTHFINGNVNQNLLVT